MKQYLYSLLALVAVLTTPLLTSCGGGGGGGGHDTAVPELTLSDFTNGSRQLALYSSIRMLIRPVSDSFYGGTMDVVVYFGSSGVPYQAYLTDIRWTDKNGKTGVLPDTSPNPLQSLQFKLAFKGNNIVGASGDTSVDRFFGLPGDELFSSAVSAEQPVIVDVANMMWKWEITTVSNVGGGSILDEEGNYHSLSGRLVLLFE